MTIYDLRRNVAVTEWHNDLVGARIHYTINGKDETLYITYRKLLPELIAICSIESEYELLDGHKISQWDALNLVIRHEYTKYMEAEIEGSDIGKAINNLK